MIHKPLNASPQIEKSISNSFVIIIALLFPPNANKFEHFELNFNFNSHVDGGGIS